MKQLIAAGDDVNLAEARKGQTALMWAAAEGHPDVVQLLIDNKAEVNAKSKSGFNALAFAAVKDDPKSVQVLLAAGADPNYALPDNAKVLLIAVAHKSSKAAAALVDGGADPNVADQGGNTPLHTAARAGDAELIKKLLAKPRGPERENRQSEHRRTGWRRWRWLPFHHGEQTPLMVAAKADKVDVMRAVAGGADTKLRRRMAARC